MIRLPELLALPGAHLVQQGATAFTGLAYDSRLARQGELFLALRTAYGDGHRYIAHALAAGCSGVLCEQLPNDVPAGVTALVVPDVLTAAQEWAARRLRDYAPLVLAVTGSVGKTSTVRALATLLDGSTPTFRTRRSFNSLLGLPVALADLAPHQRAAVLEFGIDRFGEMERLLALFPPQIAVVTTIGATHLQFFSSPAAVATEKGLLVATLPAQGCAVLNADDPLVAAMAQRTLARVITFGVEAKGPDLRASDLILSLDGTSFSVSWQGRQQRVRVGLLGTPGVYVALAALSAALATGMDFENACARLPLVLPVPGRLRPLPALAGATLLDDSYNASPPALAAALTALAALPARRRVAVLGDMHELGRAAESLHFQAGWLATTIDLLVTCGDLAAQIAAGALAAGLPAARVAVTHTAAEALAAARQELGPGDLLLVKGSATARMERVAAGLLADPSAAATLLVRQERAWETVRVGEWGRSTWIEVDLDAIAQNTRQLALLAAPAGLLAVLKADAYGHGALRVARTVLANGASSLAVATTGEARTLRDGGVAAPILVLGYTPPWQAHEAVALGVACTVFDLDCARALSAAALALRRVAAVQLKVDTGMARLGVAPEQAAPLLAALLALPGLSIEGIYTHLARADEPDLVPTLEQLARFAQALQAITAAGMPLPPTHVANSAALLRLPQTGYALARPGIALYGLAPGPAAPLPAGFRPALSWKTRLARVATVPASTPVGYGAAYVAPTPRLIATIPVGYADGFRREPHWHEVLVGSRRAPLVGRVCMDYAMIDVTDIPGVAVGDEAVLLGRQGDDAISAEEVAGWLGTNNYEVVAAIMPRVPRVA